MIWPIFLFPVNRENEAETNTLNQENVVDKEIKEDVKKPPKSSAYAHYREWIHIDGSDPTNWSATASTYDWCYKESYYYVIENVTIDGTNPRNGIGILINNSKEYFVIRNCTILDCEEGGSYDSGIKLEQTTNGTIVDNEINENHIGIYLDYYCENITILNNDLIGNDNKGIYLNDFCDDNIIFNNTINAYGGEYTQDGVYISHYSVENRILNNTINNCSSNGIYIGLMSKETIIANNTLDSIRDYGIQIRSTTLNILNNNKMKKCSIYLAGDSIHTVYTNNTINGKPVYFYKDENNLNSDNFTYAGNPGEIILANCDDSVISNFNISYGSVGISLIGCENITISNNTLKSHGVYAIDLYNECYNNTIFNNTIDGNSIYMGIRLAINNIDNNITDNTIKSTSYGIYLFNSDYNNITYNILRDNLNFGMWLAHSSDNLVFNNTIDNSQNDGMEIRSSCHNNTILNNTIKNSVVHGIELVNNCNETDIIGNLIKDNADIGLYISDASGDNCGKNNVTKNQFIGNGQHALDDHSGPNPNDWDGNYWDDYKGCDSNGDGIGETAYTIPGDAGAKDYKPLSNKTCTPYIPPADDDDDDDDDADTGSMVVLVVVLVVACAGAGIIVLFILIKKKIIMAPKSR